MRKLFLLLKYYLKLWRLRITNAPHTRFRVANVDFIESSVWFVEEDAEVNHVLSLCNEAIDYINHDPFWYAPENEQTKQYDFAIMPAKERK